MGYFMRQSLFGIMLAVLVIASPARAAYIDNIPYMRSFVGHIGAVAKYMQYNAQHVCTSDEEFITEDALPCLYGALGAVPSHQYFSSVVLAASGLGNARQIKITLKSDISGVAVPEFVQGKKIFFSIADHTQWNTYTQWTCTTNIDVGLVSFKSMKNVSPGDKSILAKIGLIDIDVHPDTSPVIDEQEYFKNCTYAVTPF